MGRQLGIILQLSHSGIGKIYKNMSCPKRKKEIENVERAYKQKI